MIELVVGEKGTDKTKLLIAKANNEIKDTGGKFLYLDTSNKHIYELSHGIRLLNVHEYNIHSSDMFLGFIYGIASQDYDIDKIFLDNFLSISCIDNMSYVETILNELSMISEKFEIDFIISISAKIDEFPELQKYVTCTL